MGNAINPASRNATAQVQQIVEAPSTKQALYKVITQLAVRILVSLALFWIFASALPLSVHAAVVMGVSVASALVGTFIFYPDNSQCPKTEPPSSLSGSGQTYPALNMSGTMGRGLTNGRLNCWVNAMAQSIRLVPPLYSWIHDKTVFPVADMSEFPTFYAKYKEAIDKGQRVATEANPTSLQQALQRKNSALVGWRQSDAYEGVVALLARYPDEWKGRIQEIREMQNGELSHGSDVSFAEVQLQIPSGGGELSDILCNRYLRDSSPAEPMWDSQGVKRPVVRTDRTITKMPPFLVVNLKRFAWPENSPRGASATKITDPVTCPDRLTIPTVSGDKTYRLTTFISHIGAADDSGHYVSYGQEQDGNRYCYNDENVALVSAASWDQAKQQAYVLFYVPA